MKTEKHMPLTNVTRRIDLGAKVEAATEADEAAGEVEVAIDLRVGEIRCRCSCRILREESGAE